MPELIRSIVGRLREFAGDRRHAYRRRTSLPLSVSLVHSLGQANGRRPVPALKGHTWDISPTGLALIVPAIRIGEHYLAGEDRRLRIVLDLPSGPLQLVAAPVRYEPLDENEGEPGYVIGARIIEISPDDLERLTLYLKSG